MAIGTGLALLGSAVIGGIGSAVSSSNSASAAKSASDSSYASTLANNNLAREVYSQNSANLEPYNLQGQKATGYINDLLGLSGDNRAASAAFDNYRERSGYKFQVDEGNKAVTANAATSGLLNSGTTLKALQERGQNLASNYFSTYLNQLSGQQGVGLSAASALAGVGNSYSSQVQANNTNNANTQANAALSKASGQNAAIGGIAGSLGSALGYMAQPSYASSLIGQTSGPSMGWT